MNMFIQCNFFIDNAKISEKTAILTENIKRNLKYKNSLKN